MNISVLEPDGTTTKLNEPGPALSEAEVAALLDATLERSTSAGWVVGCGSLPPAPPPTCMPSSSAGCASAVGAWRSTPPAPPFAAAVAATPHLIKPNHEELAELVGHDLPTLGDVRDAARELVSAGIEVVAVSLGGDGALVVTADECAHAIAPDLGPPLDRGRRRLHARRTAPRAVERSRARPTPSSPV